MFCLAICTSVATGRFCLSALVNIAATNVAIQISLEVPVLILLSLDPEVELLDHLAILFAMFWGAAVYFPQQLQHFTFPRTANKPKAADFSTSLPVLISCLYK